MATLDLNDPVDVVRLNIGDTSDVQTLQDAEIQFALDANNGNIAAATKQSAMYVLAKLSYGGHERLDKLEFWGSEVFNNYLAFIKQVINNPVFAGTAGVYVAGMDIEDTRNNKLDTTVVQHKLPVYPYGDYSDPDETVLGVYNDKFF